MTGSVLPGAAAFVGTFAGGVATWIAAHRKASGRIRTSEAEVLWAASESIRHDLTAEIAALKAELVRVGIQMAALQEANASLTAELASVTAELASVRQRLEH